MCYLPLCSSAVKVAKGAAGPMSTYILRHGRTREHGAVAPPAGSTESWNSALERVLGGLTDVLSHRRPRTVIGHGFWISSVPVG